MIFHNINFSNIDNISCFFFFYLELFINNYYINYLSFNSHLQLLKTYPLQIEIYIRSTDTSLYVKPLQDSITMNPFLEEATLLFFRFHNNSSTNLLLLTTNSIIPYEMYLYFIKLQCFCFDKIQIKSYQTLICLFYFVFRKIIF